MKTMEGPMEHPLVAEAVKDDPDALSFLRSIAFVLHTWDDLIDRDRYVADETITRAFWTALVDLPLNQFYTENQAVLRPILVNAVVNWRIANSIERAPQPRANADLVIAFIIRSAYVDLLTMSALLIGGADWAAQKGVEIRRWAHSEGFAGYLSNLAAEAAAREG